MNKQESHIVSGMSRDITVNQFNPKLVYDAKNIRITARNGNSSLLAVSNERGTLSITLDKVLKGTPIGYAVLNNYLILFTTSNTSSDDTHQEEDHIYRIEFNDTASTGQVFILFKGNMNFSTKSPIETLPLYENESIQKIYWVDGRNQPRVINIVGDNIDHNPDIVNFSREIELEQTVSVTKQNTGGLFAAGTVQYAFSYYNKFGQESRIFDYTPLYYLSPKERGLQADQTSNCSFQIKLTNLDTNFQYVRVYSIVRSSANATPNCRIVGDCPISNQTSVVSLGQLSNEQNPKSGTNYTGLHIYDSTSNTLTYLYNFDQPDGENNEVKTFKIQLNRQQYVVDINTNVAYQCEDDFYIDCYLQTATYTLQAVEFGTTRADGVGVLASATFTPGSISRGITIIDNGTYGSTVDANALLFVGGENLIASTIAQKDNTLFLGNIKLNKPNIGNIKNKDTTTFKDYARSLLSKNSISNSYVDYYGNPAEDITDQSNPSGLGFYNYSIDNNRNSQQIKRFKYGETYRLGLMAQYKDGSWSEVVWIGDFENTQLPKLSDGTYFTGAWKYTLDDTWKDRLIEEGFKKIAPVVVLPSIADRKVICQGILLPTVYNVGDRASNAPFVQSSWFVRQTGSNHNHSILGEIQSLGCSGDIHGPVVIKKMINAEGNIIPDKDSYISSKDFIGNYNEQFMMDYSILTFHSPDIEFNSNLQQSLFDGLKVRIIGQSLLDSVRTKYYLTTKNVGCASTSKIIKGGDITESTGYSNILGGYLYNNKLHPGLFMDGVVDSGVTDTVTLKSATDEMYGWCVYPWHRMGSLNNQGTLTTKQATAGYTRTAELQHKILSRLSYAKSNFELFTTINLNTRSPQLFNSDQVTAIKIPSPINSNLPNLIYYGNIDKVLVPNYINLRNGVGQAFYANYDYIDSEIYQLTMNKTKGYPINFLWFKYIGDDASKLAAPISLTSVSDVEIMEANGGGVLDPNNNPVLPLSGNSLVSWGSTWSIDTLHAPTFYGQDPVSMKYKSTPHAVIALDYGLLNGNPKQMCIPLTTLTWSPVSEVYSNTVVNYGANAFWNNGTGAKYVTSYDINYQDESYKKRPPTGIFIAELYKDTVDSSSRFGGNTDTALSTNMWLKCGTSVSLKKDPILNFIEGDTYLQRYDCLKTYPFTAGDTNSIIDIYSTEIETRVNLDERTDRNRGLTDNTIVTLQNFNLFNHAGYEQDSNYFTYQAIDYDRFKSLSYPNMITWSLEKTLGEDIDQWTSLDLTSTMDLDGDKGEITSLNVLNNEIYSFQNRGLAQLLFNSRVQIPTSDGQPIEITNGLKMQGKRYLSSMVGCSNKWSIQETSGGLYFMDDETTTLYKFGETLENISAKCGMTSWLKSHVNFDKWTPDDFKNIITFYDKNNRDLYMVAHDWCLVYSEQMGQFISFMDYTDIPVMVGIKDSLYAFNKQGTETKAWKMFSGDYNNFFGEDKPYWLTFIANENPTMDKVFNNLEFRTDMWDGNTFIPMETFDTLRVWDEHQDTGEVTLQTTSGGTLSNLKKKFNVWRANIPRDATQGLDNKPINFGLNRIRNPWAYINLKCSQKLASRHRRLQFTDLLVNYFI